MANSIHSTDEPTLVLRTVYLPPDLDDAVKHMAHERETTVSHIIREAAERVPAMVASGEI